jgi:endoglucanase
VIGFGPNLHPVITAKLIEMAETLELAHGIEPLPANTGTDAWAVEVAAGGVPCGLIGLPLRNMHSPVEVADLKDATRSARLVAAFAAQADAEFVASLAYRLPDFAETAP